MVDPVIILSLLRVDEASLVINLATPMSLFVFKRITVHVNGEQVVSANLNNSSIIVTGIFNNRQAYEADIRYLGQVVSFSLVQESASSVAETDLSQYLQQVNFEKD